VLSRSIERAEDVKRSGAWDPRKFAHSALLALALPFALLTAGCGATVVAGVSEPTVYGVYGYDAVDAGTVPVSIETYPRTYWRGSYAYLVDGMWYYPTGGRWVILNQEPRELASFRMGVRQHPHVHRAPPAQYGYPRARPVRRAPREVHREYRR
jgi:hypothetical protein